MATPWVTLTAKMDTSTTISYTARVRTNNFGDGYQSRVPDGINNVVRQYNVQYANITAADHHTLLAYVLAHAALGDALEVPVYPEDETGNTKFLFYIQSNFSFGAEEGGALYHWSIPLQQVFGE